MSEANRMLSKKHVINPYFLCRKEQTAFFDDLLQNLGVKLFFLCL